ncbi:MAG: hypothetical protein ACYTF1_12335 [Planctomycetota bacterium]|jgi:hypothetical protein
MTHKEIAQTVQSYLDKHQPKNYKLKVFESGIKQEDDWWYVTVRPDSGEIRAYDYVHQLSEIEEGLSTKESIKVLLVPALVDD